MPALSLIRPVIRPGKSPHTVTQATSLAEERGKSWTEAEQGGGKGHVVQVLATSHTPTYCTLHTTTPHTIHYTLQPHTLYTTHYNPTHYTLCTTNYNPTHYNPTSYTFHTIHFTLHTTSTHLTLQVHTTHYTLHTTHPLFPVSISLSRSWGSFLLSAAVEISGIMKLSSLPLHGVLHLAKLH